MIPRRLVMVCLLVVAFVLGGCSKRYRIEIQSDTCWRGVINDSQDFSDCGNANYKVEGKLTCITVTKQSTDGYVRVRIDGRPWAETTAPNGSVKACE